MQSERITSIYCR